MAVWHAVVAITCRCGHRVFAGLAVVGLVMLVSLPSHAAAQNIGFREITQSGVDVAVWYPTNAPHNQSRLGPFDVDYARDCRTISAGFVIAWRLITANTGGKIQIMLAILIMIAEFPLVLLSHGHSGRPRNHHLTAAALVRAG